MILGLKDWVVYAVAGGVGGLIVFLVACICWRRKNGRNKKKMSRQSKKRPEPEHEEEVLESIEVPGHAEAEKWDINQSQQHPPDVMSLASFGSNMKGRRADRDPAATADSNWSGPPPTAHRVVPIVPEDSYLNYPPHQLVHQANTMGNHHDQFRAPEASYNQPAYGQQPFNAQASYQNQMVYDQSAAYSVPHSNYTDWFAQSQSAYEMPQFGPSAHQHPAAQVYYQQHPPRPVSHQPPKQPKTGPVPAYQGSKRRYQSHDQRQREIAARLEKNRPLESPVLKKQPRRRESDEQQDRTKVRPDNADSNHTKKSQEGGSKLRSAMKQPRKNSVEEIVHDLHLARRRNPEGAKTKYDPPPRPLQHDTSRHFGIAELWESSRKPTKD